MRILTFVALMTLAVAACGGNKKSDKADRADEAECENNADCGEGMVCLDSQCADPSTKAHFTNPGRAVTPEKVKREVDKRTEEHRNRVDKSLNLE